MTKKSVGIINTPASNSLSVFRAMKWLDLDVYLIDNPKDLGRFTHIIVPGVSRFDSLIGEMNLIGFTDELQKAKSGGKAILGLCAGMQIMGKSSEESPSSQGLGWFNFDVKKIVPSKLKNVRNFHTGWNDVRGIENQSRFPVSGCYYFNHSYFVEAFSKDEVIGVTQNYVTFASVIKHENVLGAQFHPEKSQRDGLRFLKEFWELAT